MWVPEAVRRDRHGAPWPSPSCPRRSPTPARPPARSTSTRPLGGLPVLTAGSEAQKKKYLPGLATGDDADGAFSLSEPGAGSDAAGLTTTASRRGYHYVLNGTKQWCTNGDHADVITVFATVDRTKRAKGVTAFLVDKDSPGFAVGKKERKMGIRASPTVALHFNDCAIPSAQRLGAEGEGFKIAMRHPRHDEPGHGRDGGRDRAGGARRGRGYAGERQQFGQPIAAFQGIQFMLADMAMRSHASAAHDPPSPRARWTPGIAGNTYEASMAKCCAADAAMKVDHRRRADVRRLRLHARVPVERYMRDAKIMQIYEGTNQIQRHHHRQGAARRVKVEIDDVSVAFKPRRLDPRARSHLARRRGGRVPLPRGAERLRQVHAAARVRRAGAPVGRRGRDPRRASGHAADRHGVPGARAPALAHRPRQRGVRPGEPRRAARGARGPGARDPGAGRARPLRRPIRTSSPAA